MRALRPEPLHVPRQPGEVVPVLPCSTAAATCVSCRRGAACFSEPCTETILRLRSAVWKGSEHSLACCWSHRIHLKAPRGRHLSRGPRTAALAGTFLSLTVHRVQQAVDATGPRKPGREPGARAPRRPWGARSDVRPRGDARRLGRWTGPSTSSPRTWLYVHCPHGATLQNVSHVFFLLK